MIYLDNAATTFPKPETVRCAVLRCLRCFGANPGRAGHALAAKASEEAFLAREALAAFFGAQTERTIFTLNCTHAVNLALKGVLEKGDHVIISSLEHNAVLRPLERLRQDGLIGDDAAQVVPGDAAATVQNFRALIRPATKLLFVTHVSNVFGTVLPLRKLSRLAREHDLLFGVDAAQSAGVYPLSLEDPGVDLLCLPGHKGLFGPMGTGALLLSERVEPRPLLEGGTGSLSLQSAMPETLPERLESGTLNLPGVVGLRAGLQFAAAQGLDAIRAHEQALIGTLREDLSVIRGVRLFGEPGATLLSFAVDGRSSEEVAAALDRCGFAVRAGFHCAALAHTRHASTETGTVRVSPSVFTTKKQIKNFSFCVNQIALRKNL